LNGGKPFDDLVSVFPLVQFEFVLECCVDVI